MVPLLGMMTLGAGVFFMVIAAIGVLRLPDFRSRVHAVGVADSVGVALALCGLAIQCGLSVFTIKMLVLIVLLWITSTTACNAIVGSTILQCKSDDEDGG
ncbi:putative monovalent cation/H+ antiporter subunit G [Anaplasma centrale str. Israel]|uniref:Putative monovalent cation/H+ antiporter subunit G n=1 Tax=Anaplasma centrale (strain Israel) TaxID=574556 RepID=D1AU83_ANACI|nr:monovalent cation/H(+) antiporter subunit G [Anaplasma centrale]ACZ49111.1 putative monovalent cation/H+ antiporter subunit G [Anaplasma centrale str. Israel]